MALTPVEGPTTTYRRLKNSLEEVVKYGALDQWYLIEMYENHMTARSSAYRLRKDAPEGVEVRAEQGKVYARKVNR